MVVLINMENKIPKNLWFRLPLVSAGTQRIEPKAIPKPISILSKNIQS